MNIDTMKVESKDGYVIINKSDFDPKKHTEFKEKVEPKSKKGKK